MCKNVILALLVGLLICISCGKNNKTTEVTDQVVAEESMAKELENNYIEDSDLMPTIGMIADHEYVDLGLPSGTKWATVNMGAETPYEPGDSYEWGAPDPGNYFESSDGSTIGYNKNISGNSYYDVARKEWGGSWRLPTNDEIIELVKSCTWTIHETNQYQKYFLVTGPNKNSIIILMTRVRAMWGSQAESDNCAYCLDVVSASYTDGVRKGRITYAKQKELLKIRPVTD
ncbi:MAG: hypothetical protein HDS18_06515 [Bacteroides sp.]|nr:hypothetical protein [Bacteroides sp.]